MKWTTLVPLVAVVLLSTMSSGAWAAVPPVLNFSGRLGTDAGDYSGVADITLTLYDHETSLDPADVLWTDTFDVFVEAGRFHLLLGLDPSNPLPTAFLDGQDLYVGVAVGAELEMVPRMRVASVPFALRAGSASLLGGLGPEAFAPAEHSHDLSTFTGSVAPTQLPGSVVLDSELTAGLLGKADVDHDHDGTYVNEGQQDAVSGAMVLDGSLSLLDLGGAGCKDQQVARWEAASQSWVCATLTFGGSLLSGCADGDVMKWDGFNSIWICALDNGGAGGSLSGVTATAPLTSSGGATPNISLTGVIPLSSGGTDASTAAGARLNLGLGALATAGAVDGGPGGTITDGSITNADLSGSAAIVGSKIAGWNGGNWDTAYSWGNHATQGYLKSFAEADPVFAAHAASGVTASKMNTWDTAYSWGNHATQGYVKSFVEADPVFAAHAASGVTASKMSTWDASYADRLKWDGGSGGLVAATGRTSLGLKSLAVADQVSGGPGGTIADGTITDSDIASGANIAPGKIAGTVATLTGTQSFDAGTLYINAANHRIGIGTTTPNNRLQVANLINFDGARNSTFVGQDAGMANTGQNNTATGANALYSNTSGTSNTASGYHALRANTSGLANTADGADALKSNTMGSENTAVGGAALASNVAGNSNTAVGARALFSSTTESESTAVGYQALFSTTGGKRNTAIGYQALYSGNYLESSTAIGYQALFSNNADDNTAIGVSALSANTYGAGNTATGNRALIQNTIGSVNTAIGSNTLPHNTTGSKNTATGAAALGSTTTGSENTATGQAALWYNTTGNENTASGVSALYSSTTGSWNTATGVFALWGNLTGSNNTASGYHALESNTAGNANTAVGYKALGGNTTGGSNTAVGRLAFQAGSGFSNSTALGFNAPISSSNSARIGDSAVTSIGGQVGWTTLSDGRVKLDVTENVPGLAFINKLRPVTYRYDIDKENELLGMKGEADDEDWEGRGDIRSMQFTGFIAQEVDGAARDAGYDFSGVDRKGDLWGLRYAEFTVPLVKAVQEQQALIRRQQTLIEGQRAAIEGMRDEVDQLKEIMAMNGLL